MRSVRPAAESGRPQYGLIAIAGLLCGCAAKYQSRECVELRCDAGEELFVENYVGDVVIRADPNARDVRAEVTKVGRGRTQAEADAAGQAIRVRLELRPGTGGRIAAATEHPRSSEFQQYEAHWVLTGPQRMRIRVKNVVGRIEIEGFRRGAHLTTGVGGVIARDVSGGLTAIAQEGRAEIEAAGRIDVRVDVGNVDLTVRPEQPDDVEVRTRVGNIGLRLPPDRRGSLRAATKLGRIRSDLADGPAVKNLSRTDSQLHCDLGGVITPHMNAEAEIGNITLTVAEPSEPRP